MKLKKIIPSGYAFNNVEQWNVLKNQKSSQLPAGVYESIESSIQRYS